MVKGRMDLKAMEAKAYGAFRNDGLEDLAGGLCVAVYGLLILSEWFFLVGMALIVLQGLVVAARQKLVYPRLGYIQPSAAKRGEMRLFLALAMATTLLLVIATTGMMFATTSGMFQTTLQIELYVRLGVALAAVLGLAGMALLTKLRRWLLYAITTLICAVAMGAAGLDPLRGVAISSLPILATGLVMIVRLLGSAKAEQMQV